MANFVLVHGAWHGGWVWCDVQAELRAEGHFVLAPTLTGLGERSHLMDSVTGPDVHVEDICNVIRWNELDNVVLVGHSYAGMIISSVATVMEESVANLVYLDAFVPTKAQQTPLDFMDEDQAADYKALFEELSSIPASGFHRWTSSASKREWLESMVTPMPASCFAKGVTQFKHPATLKLSRSYILCDQYSPSPFQKQYSDLATDPRWNCSTINSLHDAMVDEPEKLSQMLIDAAKKGDGGN